MRGVNRLQGSVAEALLRSWQGENNGKECRQMQVRSANAKYVSGQVWFTKVRAGASIEVG